jgi:predicted nuclease with TOPRIM domain
MMKRKSEDRSRFQTRLNETIKACTKMKEDLNECQRQIEETKRLDSVERANKVQLATNLKRVLYETQKLRENVAELTKEKDSMESNVDKLQTEIFNLAETEVGLKAEKEAAVQRISDLSKSIEETKNKVDELQKEKDRVCDDFKMRLSELEAVKSCCLDGKLQDEGIYCSVEMPKIAATVALPTRASKEKVKKGWFGMKMKKDKKFGE